MTCVWVFFIIFAAITIPILIWGIKTGWDFANSSLLILAGIAVLLCLIIGVVQPIALKNEAVRQEMEREQIVYQIENMDENTDKVKLNEWILTYNDWVNDVNANKETFGWFSWYYSFDMSDHEIIYLV